MTTISGAEFERRAADVGAAATAAGFDALIAYSVGNHPGPTAYLAGYEPSFGFGDVAFVVLVPGPKTHRTLVTNSYWDDVETVAHADDVVVTRGYVDAVRDLLPQKCDRVGIVGFDFFPARILNPLAQARSGATFEDATELVQGISKIKSPAELAIMRQAAALSDEAGRRFADALVPGQSELRIQELVDKAIMSDGSDGLAFRSFVMSGPRIANGIGFATDRRVQAGDQVNVLCGARVSGYRVELGRVSTVGRPTDESLRLMDSAADMHDAMRAAIGPGVEVGDVTEAAMSSARRNGVEQHVWRPLDTDREFGHSMGCWVSEPPLIREKSSALLQAGMVLSIEARLSVPGVGGAVISEMVAVNTGGSERLSSLPLRIWA